MGVMVGRSPFADRRATQSVAKCSDRSRVIAALGLSNAYARTKLWNGCNVRAACRYRISWRDSREQARGKACSESTPRLTDVECRDVFAISYVTRARARANGALKSRSLCTKVEEKEEERK